MRLSILLGWIGVEIAFAKPLLAEDAASDADIVSEVSRDIETLHERMWRVQDDTGRRRNGGVSAGVIAGGGFDYSGSKLGFAAHLAPVIAARIYFFDTDRVLADRAGERLEHLQSFSIKDIERKTAEANRRITARIDQLQQAQETFATEEGKLKEILSEPPCETPPQPETQPLSATSDAGAPKKDSVVLQKELELRRQVTCAEQRERKAEAEKRIRYLSLRQKDADGEIKDARSALKQLDGAKQELATVRSEIGALRVQAQEAEDGTFLGGSFAEAFVGLGLDFIGSDETAHLSDSDPLVGLGYGIRWVSVGAYASHQFIGLYAGATVPVFER